MIVSVSVSAGFFVGRAERSGLSGLGVGFILTAIASLLIWQLKVKYLVHPHGAGSNHRSRVGAVLIDCG